MRFASGSHTLRQLIPYYKGQQIFHREKIISKFKTFKHLSFGSKCIVCVSCATHILWHSKNSLNDLKLNRGKWEMFVILFSLQNVYVTRQMYCSETTVVDSIRFDCNLLMFYLEQMKRPIAYNAFSIYKNNIVIR